MRDCAIALAFALSGAVAVSAAAQNEPLTVPTFGRVVVYSPTGAPRDVVLFVSGDGGWNLGVVSMAERLRDLGALVVGIDIRSFMKSLEASKSCAYVGHGFGVPRNWEPQFIEAYRAVTAESAKRPDERPHVSTPEVEDLPLVEVPAVGGADRRSMAVIVTGDGGWAEIDKSIAAGLAAAGVPTVGWSSLRYFWTPRTPERAAADLDRVITHYAKEWNTQQVLLVGYSFGADVLPFLVTRLSPDARQRVGGVTLLGLSDTAAFELHVAEWLGGGGAKKYQTVPEVERLTVPVTCVHGTDESDSACRSLKGNRISVVSVGQGHHFGGNYGRLIELILRQR